jgi:hypothetical protein
MNRTAASLMIENQDREKVTCPLFYAADGKAPITGGRDIIDGSQFKGITKEFLWCQIFVTASKQLIRQPAAALLPRPRTGIDWRHETSGGGALSLSKTLA